MLRSNQHTGVASVTLSISIYSATGKLGIGSMNVMTLGTRVLLTCDVIGLPGSEAMSYKWYHNCAGRPNSRCEIEESEPYYRVMKNTLLVDVTSLYQEGRYYCAVQHQQETQEAVTRELAVAG